ncbi:PREDICTED: uncharacterized protein LOC109340189 isoform X2 [Lupinus angustifolius]|uniref:uncharacterized protein LOC109340189 isoform X2 n=1 Tax=Lupinus angustifolius TaxID=3871 RepID=UPI00092F7B4C|nr:PREDICTED: uncharacterized protein LOC109340189 isoform X2 [Lupinus angustifolius]
MGEIEDEVELFEEKVEIILKTIGPTRPSRLLVPSSIKVRDLRRLIARNNDSPLDNLSLILRGNALCDMKNGDDVYIKLNDGDCLMVAVKPKPPVKDGYDNDDDDEDLKFQLPRSSSPWKRRLYSFLHDKLKLPDIILMVIFTLSLKAWVFIIMWFIFAPVAHRWDLGPLYLQLDFVSFSSILESAKLEMSVHILSSMKTFKSFRGHLMQIGLIEI